MHSVAKGRIIIYRLYDVASEINLSKVEGRAKEGAKRLQFSKYPYMKAIEISNPPISLELQSFNKSLFNRSIEVSVIAKAYDFGVVSVVFDMPIPDGTAFKDIELATKDLDIDKSVDDAARDYCLQVMESLGAAILNPEIKADFIEDYMVIYVERLAGGLTTQEFLRTYDPTRLLLYESRQLSSLTKRETLKHRFSYYPDDLVIIHIDNAFIIDPSGSSDIPDILEFANAQLVELRYYDYVMDNELKWIYRELSEKSVSIFRLREYERLARKIIRTVTDMTEVTEKVNNALKVTEDVYYARIYRTAMAALRSKDWETSIKEKLQIVTNTYKMLHEEISIKRGYVLELGIFVLIAIEMLLVILSK